MMSVRMWMYVMSDDVRLLRYGMYSRYSSVGIVVVRY
jgi:hypothetical protein